MQIVGVVPAFCVSFYIGQLMKGFIVEQHGVNQMDGENKQQNGKQRILYTVQYLLINAPEEKSATEIMEYVEAMTHHPVKPHTFYADMDAICQVFPVERRDKGPATRYVCTIDKIDHADMAIICNLVASNHMMTATKTNNLINMLISSAGGPDSRTDKEMAHCGDVDKAVKPTNRSVPYIISSIHRAQQEGRKISFRYMYYGIDGKKYFKHGGKSYCLSPYALTYQDGYCYLIGVVDGEDHIRNFRVDRISNNHFSIMAASAEKVPESFDLAKYKHETFRMFSGSSNAEKVTLLVTEKAMNSLVDHFGEQVQPKLVDDEHAEVVVRVRPERTFFRWIFGLSGAAKIMGPDRVVQEYKEQLRRQIEMMTQE